MISIFLLVGFSHLNLIFLGIRDISCVLHEIQIWNLNLSTMNADRRQLSECLQVVSKLYSGWPHQTSPEYNLAIPWHFLSFLGASGHPMALLVIPWQPSLFSLQHAWIQTFMCSGHGNSLHWGALLMGRLVPLILWSSFRCGLFMRRLMRCACFKILI